MTELPTTEVSTTLEPSTSTEFLTTPKDSTTPEIAIDTFSSVSAESTDMSTGSPSADPEGIMVVTETTELLESTTESPETTTDVVWDFGILFSEASTAASEQTASDEMTSTDSSESINGVSSSSSDSMRSRSSSSDSMRSSSKDDYIITTIILDYNENATTTGSTSQSDDMKSSEAEADKSTASMSEADDNMATSEEADKSTASRSETDDMATSEEADKSTASMSESDDMPTSEADKLPPMDDDDQTTNIPDESMENMPKAVQSPVCPESFHGADDDLCFSVVREEKVWEEAARDCSDKGAQLMRMDQVNESIKGKLRGSD